MASTFLTIPTPFLHKNNAISFSNKKPSFLQRSSVKINAISKKWEPTKVVPQADRVLIRLEELSDKTVGGILLPKSAVKFERYLVGEILTVGAEAGELKSGTKVLFTDINAYEVDLGTDAKHCFCKASDLLAVVE
ncbi:10 kDa chaperonin [Spatholobus suberectus]|nr:10 kDa chaperonin [Spatholobus suberectus]